MPNPTAVVIIDGTGAPQTVSTMDALLALLAAALPLPVGASTEATLAAISAKLPTALGLKTAANSLSVVQGTAGTGTQSSVGSSATDVTILAANAARLGATVFNDSTAVLYLLLGAGTSSATVHTVQMPSGGYYEVPFGYTGILKGLWAAANGSARVTEFA
jgi:hypothetical protein